jgi:hypothetical protein
MPSSTRMIEAGQSKKASIDFQAMYAAEPKSNGRTITAMRKAAGNKKARDT